MLLKKICTHPFDMDSNQIDVGLILDKKDKNVHPSAAKLLCSKRYSWHLSEDPRFDFNSSVAKPIVRTDKLRPPPPFRLKVEEIHLCNMRNTSLQSAKYIFAMCEIHLYIMRNHILVPRFTLEFGALSSPVPLSTFFYDIRF